ncbi:MAG: hypothetical protein VX004_07000 [SAR324 cluster bacterium]|nr:hypothetical protein [SAR324 cluster bacterium]
MKTVSFRLTDKQHHYLTAVAKNQHRSVEHLIWLAIAQGIDFMFSEDTYYVEKLQCDFTDEEVESMKEHPLQKPNYGTEYYGNHAWAESIADNVLDDCERTFEKKDAAFDLKAEVERTATLHAKRKAEHEARKVAVERAVATEKQVEESK